MADQKKSSVSPVVLTAIVVATFLLGGYGGYLLGTSNGIKHALDPYAKAEVIQDVQDAAPEEQGYIVRIPVDEDAKQLFEKYSQKGVCPIAPTTPPEGENVVHWSNIPELVGTDIEFQSRDGKDYAFVASAGEGLLIFDVTERTCPTLVGVHVSPGWQNDVQVQGNLVVLGTDYQGQTVAAAEHESHHQVPCPACAIFAGIELVDISDLANPRKLSDLPIEGGAHNVTLLGSVVYTSNWAASAIDVIDISDPSQPKVISRLTDAERCKVSPYPCQVMPTGTAIRNPAQGCAVVSDWRPHDVTAKLLKGNRSRLYVAASHATYIFNVDDSLKIRVIAKIPNGYTTLEDCLSGTDFRRINFSHQADPSPDGTFLVISDELFPANNVLCPSGGLHIYDITKEANPKKLGVYFANDAHPHTQCTAHVFRFLPDRNVLTASWHGTGSWVVDVSRAPEPGRELDMSKDLGRDQFREVSSHVTTWGRTLGSAIMPGAVTWAAKPLMKDGKLYFYANDAGRGLDAFEYTGTLPPPLDLPPLAPVSDADALLRSTGLEP